jgi:stress response protein YsnF
MIDIKTHHNISHEKASQIARISSLLKKLSHQVKKYTVIDREGQVVGEVRDLIIDIHRQLNFVVSKSDNQGNYRLFLLSSKLVEKVNSQIQLIFINLKKSQVEYLPNHTETQMSEMEPNSNVQQENTQNSELIAAVAAATNGQVDSVEDIIRLLGERLIVERTKRKVGEVIVRKEIETQIVQVPIRREKLIIEQVSPEYKQLAQVDLGEEVISGIDLTQSEKSESITPHFEPTTHFDGELTVSGEFSSPKIASLLLNAIALERNHKCKAVRVTVIVEDEEHQKTYQEWFARTSKR